MKTMILISITVGNDDYIPQIKDEIIKYMGTRQLIDNRDNAPLLTFKTEIGLGDKSSIGTIVKSIFESAAIFFIELDDNDTFGESSNWATLIPQCD